MRRVKLFLILNGLLLLVVAAVLLVVHTQLSFCLQGAEGECLEVGFAYEGGGKLALLAGFASFLLAALLGLFNGPGTPGH